MSKRGTPSSSRSGYFGVYPLNADAKPNKKNARFRACLTFDDRQVQLGVFKTAVNAAKCVDYCTIIVKGTNCKKLNFPKVRQLLKDVPKSITVKPKLSFHQICKDLKFRKKNGRTTNASPPTTQPSPIEISGASAEETKELSETSFSSVSSSVSSATSAATSVTYTPVATAPHVLFSGLPYNASAIRHYYDALVIYDMYGLKQLVRKGDTVLLQSSPGEKPYLCQVREVWRDAKTGESYLRGVWFYRQEDLPPSVVYPIDFDSNKGTKVYKNKQEQKNDPCSTMEHIFLSQEKFVNSAETILAKAVVVYATDEKQSRDWKINQLYHGIKEEREEIIKKYMGKVVFHSEFNTLFRTDYHYKAKVYDVHKQIPALTFVALNHRQQEPKRADNIATGNATAAGGGWGNQHCRTTVPL